MVPAARARSTRAARPRTVAGRVEDVTGDGKTKNPARSTVQPLQAPARRDRARVTRRRGRAARDGDGKEDAVFLSSGTASVVRAPTGVRDWPTRASRTCGPRDAVSGSTTDVDVDEKKEVATTAASTSGATEFDSLGTIDSCVDAHEDPPPDGVPMPASRSRWSRSHD